MSLRVMSFKGFPSRIAPCPVVSRDVSTLGTAFAGVVAGVDGEHPAKTTATISIDVIRMGRTLLAGHGRGPSVIPERSWLARWCGGRPEPRPPRLTGLNGSPTSNPSVHRHAS